MSTKSTLFVVDVDSTVHRSLTELAASMRLSVECYNSAERFLDSIDPSQAGCLILEIVLPGMDGLELQEKLTAQGVSLPVIFLTSEAKVRRVVRALKQGAIDLLEKPSSLDQLREIIRQAIEQDATHRRLQEQRDGAEQRLAQLTSDERAVIRGITAGKTNRDIASDLDVSLRTVQLRRSSLMKKLNVSSRAALVELLISVPSHPEGLFE